MPKINNPQNEPDDILQAMELLPKEGVSREAIGEALRVNLHPRTLQRHIRELVKQGLLLSEGRGKACRYRLPSQTPEKIHLSPVARSLQVKVLEPIQKRQFVNYNRDFLDKYRPNETHYLPQKVLNHLLEIGKSPDGKRPAGTYARQIFDRLLIDLSWNSSRLEGNTYSLLETKRLLEWGEVTEGKNAMEAQMILNHKAAIEFLVESAENLRFNRFTIFNLHALLSNNLLPNPKSCGNLRTIPVGIGKSVYIPLAIPQLIDECFQQILDTAQAIENPFEQAFFVMVHLPYLQPFEDVNKRVSRLSANIPLIRDNLCPLSFVDVPEDLYINGLLSIYELNRMELLKEVFIWAYERSCSLYTATRNILGEPDLFRLRYRDLIHNAVSETIRQCMNKKTAIAFIKEQSLSLPVQEQTHFIEVIETEIMGLHEGNIARYRLRLSEFQEWKKVFFDLVHRMGNTFS